MDRPINILLRDKATSNSADCRKKITQWSITNSPISTRVWCWKLGMIDCSICKIRWWMIDWEEADAAAINIIIMIVLLWKWLNFHLRYPICSDDRNILIAIYVWTFKCAYMYACLLVSVAYMALLRMWFTLLPDLAVAIWFSFCRRRTWIRMVLMDVPRKGASGGIILFWNFLMI